MFWKTYEREKEQEFSLKTFPWPKASQLIITPSVSLKVTPTMQLPYVSWFTGKRYFNQQSLLSITDLGL